MNFRLINYQSNDAATNMAIDEAILEAHLNSLVPPTLRFYTFSPPAISFGYAQKTNNATLERIQKQGFNIVRRPTGGRAVLHFGDLTYAFICSTKHAPIEEYAVVSDSITLAYKQICNALILALKCLGIKTTLGQSTSSYKDKQDCFLATTAADLQYSHKKIIGSAQLRRRHAVLQHGSLILNQPQALMNQLLESDVGKGDTVEDTNHHVNLFDILDQEYSIEQLENTITGGFEAAFRTPFVANTLITQEESFIKKLIPKYKVFI